MQAHYSRRFSFFKSSQVACLGIWERSYGTHILAPATFFTKFLSWEARAPGVRKRRRKVSRSAWVLSMSFGLLSSGQFWTLPCFISARHLCLSVWLKLSRVLNLPNTSVLQSRDSEKPKMLKKVLINFSPSWALLWAGVWLCCFAGRDKNVQFVIWYLIRKQQRSCLNVPASDVLNGHRGCSFLPSVPWGVRALQSSSFSLTDPKTLFSGRKVPSGGNGRR